MLAASQARELGLRASRTRWGSVPLHLYSQEKIYRRRGAGRCAGERDLERPRVLLSAVHVTVRRCLCVIVMLGSGGPPFLYTWTAARHVGFILEMVPPV